MRSRFPPYSYLTRILESHPLLVSLYYQLWSEDFDKIYLQIDQVFYFYDLLNIHFEEQLEVLAELELLDWEINRETEEYEITLQVPHAPGEGKALS
jgi:hypothetical protein